jgi:hypothetical protein
MLNPDSANGAAVVLAATACEIKLKQKIAALANEDQERLLEIMMPVGKQSKVPVPDMVKVLTKAIIGRSLVEDNADLARRYGELVKARNTFAHRGVDVDEPVAWSHITTAREVFQWIDSLS